MKPLMQRQANGDAGGASTAPPVVQDVLRSPGQSLNPASRGFMESRFGHDFSQVRVHSDARAAESARAVNARAYTVGRDVVFGSGQYAPGSSTGQHLLAHELTHVIQQSEAPPSLQRWKVDGNTATAEKEGDYLGRLATQVGARAGDWKCIKPIKMKTHSSGKAPADFNKRYERYVQIGDTFDVSNLKETGGKTLTMHLFDDASEKMDADLAKLFYTGSKSTGDADIEIDSTSNSGSKPIGKITIFGHASGGSMWGAASTFTPSGFKSEEPEHSHTLASVGLFPRRCWLTRNASVRSVGCNSTDWGKDFAAAYLRKGAKVITTTKSVRPKCRGLAYEPSTRSCTFYNGVDFASSSSSRARSLDGPFWSASDFHGGRFWTTIKGKL